MKSSGFYFCSGRSTSPQTPPPKCDSTCPPHPSACSFSSVPPSHARLLSGPPLLPEGRSTRDATKGWKEPLLAQQSGCEATPPLHCGETLQDGSLKKKTTFITVNNSSKQQYDGAACSSFRGKSIHLLCRRSMFLHVRRSMRLCSSFRGRPCSSFRGGPCSSYKRCQCSSHRGGPCSSFRRGLLCFCTCGCETKGPGLIVAGQELVFGGTQQMMKTSSHAVSLRLTDL